MSVYSPPNCKCGTSAKWYILLEGVIHKMVCDVHRKDFERGKGKRVIPMPGYRIMRLRVEDWDAQGPPRGPNMPKRMDLDEMHALTSALNEQGKPIVVKSHRHLDGTATYTSRGITRAAFKEATQ